MSHLISFSRYQTKQVIKLLFRPLKQWLTGKKEGKMKIQKFEYLDNEKSFLDEIKNISHSF